MDGQDDIRFTPAKSVNRDVGDVGQDGRMADRMAGWTDRMTSAYTCEERQS